MWWCNVDIKIFWTKLVTRSHHTNLLTSVQKQSNASRSVWTKAFWLGLSAADRQMDEWRSAGRDFHLARTREIENMVQKTGTRITSLGTAHWYNTQQTAGSHYWGTICVPPDARTGTKNKKTSKRKTNKKSSISQSLSFGNHGIHKNITRLVHGCSVSWGDQIWCANGSTLMQGTASSVFSQRWHLLMDELELSSKPTPCIRLDFVAWNGVSRSTNVLYDLLSPAQTSEAILILSHLSTCALLQRNTKGTENVSTLVGIMAQILAFATSLLQVLLIFIEFILDKGTKIYDP